MFDGPDGAEIFPGNASKFDIYLSPKELMVHPVEH
jgi:hypothetical protein